VPTGTKHFGLTSCLGNVGSFKDTQACRNSADLLICVSGISYNLQGGLVNPLFGFLPGTSETVNF